MWKWSLLPKCNNSLRLCVNNSSRKDAKGRTWREHLLVPKLKNLTIENTGKAQGTQENLLFFSFESLSLIQSRAGVHQPVAST